MKVHVVSTPTDTHTTRTEEKLPFSLLSTLPNKVDYFLGKSKKRRRELEKDERGRREESAALYCWATFSAAFSNGVKAAALKYKWKGMCCVVLAFFVSPPFFLFFFSPPFSGLTY
jgi:hypothetical protein